MDFSYKHSRVKQYLKKGEHFASRLSSTTEDLDVARRSSIFPSLRQARQVNHVSL